MKSTYCIKNPSGPKGNLIKGLFGLIRNPTAHRPKITFPITEPGALDIMGVVSLVHKKLDGAL
jgi:hypothetical protein